MVAAPAIAIRPLLTLELPHQMNFLAIAIPGVIAALAIFMVNLKASVAAQTPSTR
jgi:AAHS family benzoate transporter-like MFS transporter